MANGTNKRILAIIEERLQLGNLKFGKEMPLDGESNRDNAKELSEEIFDSLIYCAGLIMSEITTKERYKQAYELCMEHFDLLPADIKKDLDKKLEELEL